MKKLTILFLITICFLSFAHASDVTHLLGTTGYMIQEALHAGAAKKDPENYNKALKLQKQAKKYFRGDGVKRNLDKVVELTREAYLYAKQARDNSKKWPLAPSQDNFYKSIQRVK